MKSKEQIEAAQCLITNTQDFVELANVEKKLKVAENRNSVAKLVERAEVTIKSKVEEI